MACPAGEGFSPADGAVDPVIGAGTQGGPHLWLDAQQQYMYGHGARILDGTNDYYRESGTAEEFLIGNVAWFWMMFRPDQVGVQTHLFSRLSTSSGRSYACWVSTSGIITWRVYETGSVASEFISDITLPSIDALDWYGLLCYVDFPNDKMGVIAQSPEDPSYLALDHNINSDIVPSIFTGGAQFTLGADADKGQRFDGNIARFAYGTTLPADPEEMFSVFYNAGNAITYAGLTAAEITNYGIQHWFNFMENDGNDPLIDSHGGLQLTEVGNTPPTSGPDVFVTVDSSGNNNHGILTDISRSTAYQPGPPGNTNRLAEDSHDTGHVGRFTNEQWSTDHPTSGFSIDCTSAADDAIIEVPTLGAIDRYEPASVTSGVKLSVSFWLKRTEEIAEAREIFRRTRSGEGFVIGWQSSTANSLRITRAGLSVEEFDDYQVPLNTWVKIRVVTDQSNCYLYVNDVLTETEVGASLNAITTEETPIEIAHTAGGWLMTEIGYSIGRDHGSDSSSADFYWPCDEGSGVTLRETGSGFKNHGHIYPVSNEDLPVMWQNAGELRLDSSGSAVADRTHVRTDFTDDVGFRSSWPLTLAITARHDNTGVTENLISLSGGATETYYFRVIKNTSEVIVVSRAAGAGEDNTPGPTISDPTASYTVVVRVNSDTSIDIWLDGVKTSYSDTARTAPLINKLVVGLHRPVNASGTQPFTGHVKNAVFWNYGLSDADCAAYASGNVNGAPMVYWGLGDGDSCESIENSIDFDGTNDYIAIPVIPNPGSELTVSAWANHESEVGPQNYLWWGNGAASNDFMSFGLHSTEIPRLQHYDNGTLTNYDPGGVIASFSGRWHHFTWTYKDGVLASYIDGVLHGTERGVLDPDVLENFDVAIGCNADSSPGAFMNGKLSGVRLFDSSLTQAEVLELYRTGAVTGKTPTGEWKLADGDQAISAGDSVTRWEDRSGYGNDVTQPTATKRPELLANGGVAFDGTDDFLANQTVSGAAGGTVFVVAKYSTAPAAAVIDAYPNTPNRRTFATTGESVGIRSSSNVFAEWVWTDDERAVIAVTFNSSSSRIWFNGTKSLRAVNPGTGAWAGAIVGAALNEGDNWAGDIFEVISYDEVLSDADIESVSAALISKWNISTAVALPTPLVFLNSTDPNSIGNPSDGDQVSEWLNSGSLGGSYKTRVGSNNPTYAHATRSLYFNGVDRMMDSEIDAVCTGAYTIHYYINRTLNAWGGVVGNKDGSTNVDDNWTGFDNTQKIGLKPIENSTTVYTTPNTNTTDDWVPIAVGRNADGTIFKYSDGVEHTGLVATDYSGTTRWNRIGSNFSTGGAVVLEGYVRNVRIYDSRLTAKQIASLAHLDKV